MDPRVVAELARNFGLITYRRATELGMSPREIARAVRSGDWIRVRRGVYADAPTHAAAVTLGQRQRLIDRAACLRVAPPFVRSHVTAALELGLTILVPRPCLTHVTRDCSGSHKEHGVQHHLAPYRPEDVVDANGFPVLAAVRTAVDIARTYGHPYGVVAVDAVRQLGHAVEEFEEILSAMLHWPDHRRAVNELALSESGAESVGETLGRLLLVELGHTNVETQFGLTDGRRTAFADLRVGRHLVEFDGRRKYLADLRGPRDVEDVVLEEKAREDWLRGFRLGVSRVDWDDVWGAGRHAAKARLAREIDATTRLWGTDVRDLARYRVARGARRAA